MQSQSRTTSEQRSDPQQEVPVGGGAQPASANQVGFGGPLLPDQPVRNEAIRVETSLHDGIVVVARAIVPALYEKDEQGHQRLIKPAEPCPELLTAEEASRYLRLDVKNAGDTLRYYRQRYGLRVVQISRNILYPREELDALWRRLMEANPR